MKLVIAASTAAFDPSQVAQTSTFLNVFEGEVEAQAPLRLFDALEGLTS